MKKITLLLLMFPISLIAQTIQKPSNVYFTLNEIKGNAEPNSLIKLDRNVGSIANKPIITIMVNNNGFFAYTFETALPLIAGTNSQPQLTIWAEDNRGNLSAKETITAMEINYALNNLSDGSLVLPVNQYNPLLKGSQPKSTTFKYKVTMLNTNFTVPIARFNFVADNNGSKHGDLLLFNSVGAGVGISGGEMEKTTDASGNTINIEYSNTLGVHLGLLFSSGNDGNEQKNIFAPTITFSILDFQIGLGYELGSVMSLQKKGFLTLAYAIPLSKLIKGNYYVMRATPGYNDTHSLPPYKNTKSSVNGFL
ncbi:MAG: hypothetical protein EOO99_02530 [Pedobacter sp.]|nr:MAG: hypothetical protein EOO99_02530 [Pedobacter sp.]